jgi:hypothetical protein
MHRSWNREISDGRRCLARVLVNCGYDMHCRWNLKISDGRRCLDRILTNPATACIVAGIVRFQTDDVAWTEFLRIRLLGKDVLRRFLLCLYRAPAAWFFCGFSVGSVPAKTRMMTDL